MKEHRRQPDRVHLDTSPDEPTSRSADLRSGAFLDEFLYSPGRRPALQVQCQDAPARPVNQICPPGTNSPIELSPAAGKWPVPDALAVFIDFANAVKGHAMDLALVIHEPESLRIVAGKGHLPERNQDNPIFNPVKVTQLEIPTRKPGVPVNAV